MAAGMLSRARELRASGVAGAEEMEAYAHVHLGQFNEAMDALGDAPPEAVRSLLALVLRTYCLYRLGKLVDSLGVSACMLRLLRGESGQGVEGADDTDEGSSSLAEAVGGLLRSKGAAAASLADTHGGDWRLIAIAALQIRAQVLAKLGRHAASAHHLQALIAASKSRAKDVDVVTNLVAALASSGERGACEHGAEVVQDWTAAADSGEGPPSSYELVFNGACAAIGAIVAGGEDATARGGEAKAEAEAAGEQLSLAREMAEAMLQEDGCSKEDMFEELIEVSVQEAFLASIRGERSRAAEMYLELLRRRPSGATGGAGAAIATNNLAAARGERRDLGDSRKRLERLMGDSSTMHALTHEERRTITFNRIVLLMHAVKLGAASTAIGSFERDFPEAKAAVMAARLKASLFVRDGKPELAEDMLAKLLDGAAAGTLDAGDGARDALLLLHAQVAALTGSFDSVVASLGRITSDDVRYSPAVVATVAQAHEKMGNADAGAEELERAAAWWSESMRDDAEADRSLWALNIAAAEESYTRGRYAAAVRFYGILKEKISGGAHVPPEFEARQGSIMFGYARSLLQVDAEEAKSFADGEIPEIAGAAELDADNLERSFRGGIVHARENLGSKERIEAERAAVTGEVAGTAAAKKAKKKKRKIRYPKGFDPANPGPPPDPERWLPLRERSTFKKKGQRRKNRDDGNIRGAQGAVLSKEEKAAEESPILAAKAQEIMMKGKGKRRSGRK